MRECFPLLSPPPPSVPLSIRGVNLSTRTEGERASQIFRSTQWTSLRLRDRVATSRNLGTRSLFMEGTAERRGEVNKLVTN